MKSIAEIEEKMNRPKFTDIFGNEIEANDVIALTYSNSKKLLPYIVTDEWRGNNVKLIELMNKHVRSFDVSKLGAGWDHYNCIKINASVPQIQNSTVTDSIQDRKNLLIQRKEQAAINRAKAIQKRAMFIFAKNNENTGIIITNVESQAGKVISNNDLMNAVKNLFTACPNYTFAIYDNNNTMIKLKPNMTFNTKALKAIKNHIISPRHDCNSYGNSVLRQRAMFDNIRYNMLETNLINKFIPIKSVTNNIELEQRHSYSKYFSYNNSTNYYFEVPAYNSLKYTWSKDKGKNVYISDVFNQDLFNKFRNFALLN